MRLYQCLGATGRRASSRLIQNITWRRSFVTSKFQYKSRQTIDIYYTDPNSADSEPRSIHWRGTLQEARGTLQKASVALPETRNSYLSYPTSEEGIPQVREELERRPWGLATYRTAYGGHSDRQFAKLRKLIEDEGSRFLHEIDQELIQTSQPDWPFIENKRLLSNVTTQVVREEFSRWASDRGVPATDDGWGYEVPRFHYCLIADRRSVYSADTSAPFIGVVYKDWESVSQRKKKAGLDYVPGEWDAIEGNTDRDIGWFYSPISSLVWDYRYMCLKGLWDRTMIPYHRVPHVSNASSDLRRWRGDKKEGHHRGLGSLKT